MALITRRLFLIAPAAAAAVWIGAAEEGVEALDAPPLAGALHANGSPAKGFRHAQLRGWVSVVHALTSWRPECEAETPVFRELARDERIQLAGLFVQDKEDDARAFIERNGNPYDALAFDSDGRAARSLGLRETPSTFVLNVRGEIIHVLQGPLTREYLAGTLLPVIEEASPMTPLLAGRASRTA